MSADASLRRRRLALEVSRFLLVGAGAFLIEAGLSTVLVYGVPGLLPAALPGHPLLARVIATAVAMAVAWLGNRVYTYGHRETGSPARGIARFVTVNVLAMGIALVPLGLSWYVLGLRDPLSYNVSANVVGTALAMTFRFFGYRSWVFRETSGDRPDRTVLSDPLGPDHEHPEAAGRAARHPLRTREEPAADAG